MSCRYTLIHLTDLHVTPGMLHGSVDSVAALRLALRAAVDADQQIDAVIVSGDLTDRGDAESYRIFAEEFGPVVEQLGAVPVLAIGNHDRPAEIRRSPVADAATAGADQVTMVGGLRVITLDSTVPDHHHGRLGEDQLRWLARVLESRATDGSILVLHHPPIPSVVPVMNQIGLREPERLSEVLAGSDVRIVLCGHTHCATAGTVAGVPVWVGPASAYLLDPLPPAGTVRALGIHMFSRVDVAGADVTVTAVPITGPEVPAIYTVDAEVAAAIAGDGGNATAH